MEATVQLNARVQSRLGDAKTILKLDIRWKNHCQKLLFSPSSYQRYCSLSRGQDPDLEFCVCVCMFMFVCMFMCAMEARGQPWVSFFKLFTPFFFFRRGLTWPRACQVG